MTPASARDSAWAFALTGERSFADDAAAILLGYADRYQSYPYHCNAKNPTQRRDSGGHIKEQALSEASVLVRDLAPALDLIRSALDERRAPESRAQHQWQWGRWQGAVAFAAPVPRGNAVAEIGSGSGRG